MSPRDANGLHDATRAQIRAAEPGGSAWVSANAGSGKTRVLTTRVARLLLAGARPERILCLTYTKAAAAEMQNRLFETLGGWAMMPDDRLAAALQELSETPVAHDAAELGRARRLFAQALETPGGLKIQTIHAFCDALLRRFPLEAGVSPRFAVLDDRQARAMIEAIRDRMAARAEAGEDDAFDAVADRAAETTLDALAAAAIAKRAAFPRDAGDALADAFGVTPGTDPEAEREALAAAIDPSPIHALAEIAAHGGKRAQGWAERAAALDAHLEAGETDAALDAFERLALKADGDPINPEWQFGKNAVAEDPWIAETLAELSEQALVQRERRNALAAWERSRALHRFAAALLQEYEAEKTRAGALDFEDLVTRAAGLLTTSEMAAWALWKLDGGIEHLLIDEAQDTAPNQWTVIRAIAEEFFSGAGAAKAERTLFVVGDEKQSIYSFQGAEPREFGRMRDHFARRLETAERGLHLGGLAHSFRSAPAVLRLVDAVFAGEAAEGLSSDAAPPRHVAFHAAAAGLVELWPFLGGADDPEEPHWTEPVDAPSPADPRSRLAEAVAEHVAALVHEGAALPDRKGGGWRPMRPRDLLILVQRRDRLARGIIRGLKRRGVEVAGEDRLSLTAELAVKDLVALIRVAAEEGDDLSLAAVLRSPLGGLSEDDLFSLAHGRDGSLWKALMDREDDFPEAAALIRDIRGRADFDRPYELLERALVRHDGRTRLLARLGGEAEDPIDELLAQALAYERLETPSLAGFLAWLDADEGEIKREQGGGADEVRVMTVHGAKGLEAPFVILPDCGPRRRAPGGRPILRLPAGDAGVAAWSMPKAEAPEAMRAAMEEADRREEEESRRLLYVALTRAEDRLLVCGSGDEAKADACWHGLVRRGMEALGAEAAPAPAALGPGAEPVLRLAERWRPAAAGAAANAEDRSDAGGADDDAGGPDLGSLAILSGRRAPAAPPPPRRLNASALGGDEGPPGSGEHETRPALGRDLARRRGDAIHLLLERLPAAPPADRQARAEALLASEAADLGPDLRAEAVAEALAVLAMPELAPLIKGDALAEAGFSAFLPELGATVTGRADLLIVEDGSAVLIDFKTGAPPPDAGAGAAPEPYLRQMAAYRAGLARLHPGLGLRAGLLWTRGPRLDWLPDAALDAAFARLRADLAAGAAAQDPLAIK